MTFEVGKTYLCKYGAFDVELTVLETSLDGYYATFRNQLGSVFEDEVDEFEIVECKAADND